MSAIRLSSAVLSVLVGAPFAWAEWGTTQGDAAHSGYVPMTVTATAPNRLWSDSGMLVQSNFAAGGGNLFYVTHVAGTGWADSLYAVNEQTGSVLWKKSPAQTTGDPAYANGSVYLQIASSQNLNLGWNVQTGTQVFSASYSNQFSTYLAPVLRDGTLYAGGGYYGGQAYAYDTATSAVKWSTNVQYSGSYGDATPAVDANYVYFVGGEGSDLIIANRATGALVSEIGTHNETGSGSPVLTGNGGAFYIANGTGQFVDVSNPAAPRVVWTHPNLYEWNYPAYANGTFYVSGNLSTSPTLYALNAADGQVEWSLAGVSGVRNVIVTDNVLLAAEGTNTVAISLATHQVLWSVPITGTMTVSDNELFIGSDGVVSAYAIAAPEPSSLVLFAPAVARLFSRRRRR